MKPEQITAWALDEASAEECQQLEAALLDNPTAKHSAEETKAFCDFLFTELRDESLALTEAQRERLVEQASRLQEVAQSSRLPATSGTLALPTRWRIGGIVRLAVAACAVLGGFWSWHVLSLRETAQEVAVVDEVGVRVNLPKAAEAKKHEGMPPTVRLLAEVPVQGAAMGKALEPVAGVMPSPAPVSKPVPAAATLALKKSQGGMTAGDVAELKKVQDQQAYGLDFGGRAAVPVAQPEAALPGLIAQGVEADGFINLLLSSPSSAVPVQGGITLPSAGGIVNAGTGLATLTGANTLSTGATIQTDNSGLGGATGAVSLTTSTAAPMPTMTVMAGSTAVVANVTAGTGFSTISGAVSRPAAMNVPVDLMSAPTITTKSGTKATMEVTREFVYPTEFAGNGGIIVNGAASAAPTATPSQPGMIAGAGSLVLTSKNEGNLVLAGGMTKAGVGTLTVNGGTALTMNGVNTYSGTTTVNGVLSPTVSASPSEPSMRYRITRNVGSLGQKDVASGSLAFGTPGLNGGVLSPTVSAPASTFGGFNASTGGMNDGQEVSLGLTTALAPRPAATPQMKMSPMSGTVGTSIRTYMRASGAGDTSGSTLNSSGSPAPASVPLITFSGGGLVANGVVASTPAAKAASPLAGNLPSDTRYFASANSKTERAEKDSLTLGAMPFVGRLFKDSPQDYSNESYTRIIENEMKDVAREPLSTLSIDVDTASYANVRRFLNQNMIPPPDAVRIEELVNYFPTAEEGPAHAAKEPFAVRVELAPCPWQPEHRLARIAIKGREMDKDRKASNLVFLVDVSGSMNEPTKLPLVQQSLRMLTEQLGEGDRVTMVVYAGSSGVVLPPTNGENKAEILAAIDKLSAGGSTHGSAGIKLAYEQAVAGFIKGGVNRVILCTDGDFNVGVSSPAELERLIKQKAKSGVFLSVLGFGSGNLKDRTMETLADKGNGNYAYIDSLSEARKVLVEQMSGTLVTIAKDVKIQVEFNPAAVRSYRLIGYENRLLAKEDFNDDTKDAGEIGAGHSVVALYEVVPANLPPGAEPRPAVDNLKYQAPAVPSAQLAEAAKSGEMMTVKLRYKEPESDLSKLIEVPTKDTGETLTASTAEFKFSAAVAGFGLLLRDSSYKGTLSWETVRRLALDGKGADKQGYRGEFLQLIDKARGLKETR
jgi:secreted protein with Ig-like and vWFA domain